LERVYRKKDGTTIPVLIEDRLVRDEKGAIRGIRCTIQDITERKQNEEKILNLSQYLNTIIDNADIWLDVLDDQGNVVIWNKAAEEISGYSREEVAGHNRIWEWLYPEEGYLSRVLSEVKISLEGTQARRAFETIIRRKDGTSRIISWNSRSLSDERGTRIGMIALGRDITQPRKAEKEMASLQEQFRQSQKMEAIGHLAGGIAHDFHNLLTVIQGYSQLSLMDLKDSPLEENLIEIKRAAERAATLTRQLLAFSRRQVMEMKVLDLNGIVKNLEKMLCRVIGEDVELFTILSENLGKVKSDPGQIEQVLLNLTVNARDAMPGGGKLIIETVDVNIDQTYAQGHISVKPGRYVMLSVTDTGIGMTPEVRERIFEPFFTTKERGRGTGLGLSTAYGIVKQSGGNIWVYSEPGQGTAFKIYLPRVEESAEEAIPKSIQKNLSARDEAILVVEDEEVVRKLTVKLLQRQGYRIFEARHWEEALAICEKKEAILLILTDVVMPEMNGPQLMDRL
ncbi:MAG: PAS domain-containing hybrid sensor histidine kinase/response regulator, partial [Deltaproteobacteria bacterium]